jgi:UDP-N-acetylmuramyl-tripeptide synthetase
VEVADTARALGELAAAFFSYPAREMTIIGITGTNGKTTSTYLLEDLLAGNGWSPGVIGTVNYRYGKVAYSASHTTPDSVTLHGLLREMADNKVTHVIMEVSSHALSQQRLSGLQFDLALFTNLSRDHLDYHADMNDYFVAKQQLFFQYLGPEGKAVIVLSGQADDQWGEKMQAGLTEKIGKERVLGCGKGADVQADDFSFSINGIKAGIITPWGDFQLSSPLVGEFNLYNLLGVTGVALYLGIKPEEIGRILGKAGSVPGRLERIEAGEGTGGPAVFVDYAHTPDALENVLLTLRALKPCRLIVVFGCGGDRDQGKRPLMGEIAARLADVVLLTSDNPRSEEPKTILAAVEQGIKRVSACRFRDPAQPGEMRKWYEIIESRGRAIAAAISLAGKEDIVLISGKGHEQYQLTSSGKTFFDDRQEALHQLNAVIHQRERKWN